MDRTFLLIQAIYSSAFRAPAIENIAGGIKNFTTLEPGIKAEKTTVVELGSRVSTYKKQPPYPQRVLRYDL